MNKTFFPTSSSEGQSSQDEAQEDRHMISKDKAAGHKGQGGTEKDKDLSGLCKRLYKGGG